MGKGAADTARMTRFGMREAVVAPLKDFGLVKAKVPAILTAASEEVYKLPERTDCAYLGYEVAQLDLALGPDVDVPRVPGIYALWFEHELLYAGIARVDPARTSNPQARGVL